MGNAGRNRAGCCKNGTHRTKYQLLRAGLLHAVQRWLQGVPHAVQQRRHCHLLRPPCATVSAQKAKCSLPANRSSFIRAARCLSKQTTLSSCSSAISICRRCKNPQESGLSVAPQTGYVRHISQKIPPDHKPGGIVVSSDCY